MLFLCKKRGQDRNFCLEKKNDCCPVKKTKVNATRKTFKRKNNSHCAVAL